MTLVPSKTLHFSNRPHQSIFCGPFQKFCNVISISESSMFRVNRMKVKKDQKEHLSCTPAFMLSALSLALSYTLNG